MQLTKLHFTLFFLYFYYAKIAASESLSKATVVGEASRRSGTLITVNYALSSNKDVGCVPFRATEDSACNALIKDGAFMVESPEDVLLMMGDIRGERERLKR